jgi:predicted lipid-binding transport protein (Tim44 family)
MTGIEHEADGSWLVPLLLLVAICWQLWVSLRYTKPSDGDSKPEADNKPATAWPFPIDFTGLYRERQPGALPAQGDALPPETPFASAVRALRHHDPAFAIEPFLDHAQAAYEAIVTAFALGDNEALAALATPEVYASYAAAIVARAGGERCTGMALVRLARPHLIDIAIDGDHADIRIRFAATWLSVSAIGGKAAAAGIAIANTARDTVDEWTFTRRLGARDPRWWLAASN